MDSKSVLTIHDRTKARTAMGGRDHATIDRLPFRSGRKSHGIYVDEQSTGGMERTGTAKPDVAATRPKR